MLIVLQTMIIILSEKSLKSLEEFKKQLLA